MHIYFNRSCKIRLGHTRIPHGNCFIYKIDFKGGKPSPRAHSVARCPFLRGHPATPRLSDAFITAPEKPSLELIVSVTNINYNKDNKILHTCKPLKEYTLFIEAVRKHIELDSENGFRNAIKECIQNDILREYLQRKSREVMNMLIAEYDYDVDIAVQREEEREIALKEGSYQAKP